ncbi:MAG: hypothetical protein RRB13_03250 [bacterium]|nr:hypothetical protein [bacterium]
MILRFTSSILFAALWALPALAAGGGQAAAGSLFSADMAYKTANFLILLALLHLLAKKPIAKMMRDAAEAKRERFLEQKKAVEAAEADLVAFRQKIEAQEAELASHRKAALAAIEAEKNRIVKEAQDQAANIEKNAQMRIDQALIRAKSDLRSFLAAEASDLAENSLKKSIGAKDQEALIKSYTADFPAKN